MNIEDIVKFNEGDIKKIKAPRSLTSTFKRVYGCNRDEYDKGKDQGFILRGLKMEGNEYLIAIDVKDSKRDYASETMGGHFYKNWSILNILSSFLVKGYDEGEFVVSVCPKEMNEDLAVFLYRKEKCKPLYLG